MSIPAEVLEVEVLNLPPAERARLLDRLLLSLDPDPECSSTGRKMMACASQLSRINVAALAIGALVSELHAFLLLAPVTSNASFRRTPQKRGISELKR